MRVGNRKIVLYPNYRIYLVLASWLCSLSISQWSASKHDRQASEEIAAHHGAQPDVGRYNKLLIPKETLAEVRRLAGEAGREHYVMTLPWDDNLYKDSLPGEFHLSG